jgi:serine/threonine protein kinase
VGLRALGPGDVVAGRYRVEAVIGRGGYGLVLRATQLNLGRPVALKVLLAAHSLDPRTFERFMREALVAQRLEHPNTVRIYDLGQTEEGVPFLAFELLRGESLDQVLARDRFSSAPTAPRASPCRC